MAVHLLDVNVLIALMDPAHEHHPVATKWFRANRAGGWATCPSTEAGLVRILSNPKYPNVRLTPGQAAAMLTQLVEANRGVHHWWPETISIRDTDSVDCDAIQGYKQITDTCLLALAAANEGKLATFDQRIVPAGAPRASREHLTAVRD